MINQSKLRIFTYLLLIVATSVVAAENIHEHNNDDMHSGFAISEDEHDHDKEASTGKPMHDDKHDAHKDETHASHSEHDEHGDGTVTLDESQLKTAGIQIEAIHLQNVSNSLIAPGEVLFNAYRSKKMTPRISAQIIKRHQHLGDKVKEGQILVTLSSVEMAQAQGNLTVADREWQRVKKMGINVVSERRYVEAQIARQQAYARVSAFGMTDTQIAQLLKTDDPAKAVGQFNLLASQIGTITSDDFVEGQIVEPGQVLFEITDETTMWVEARLTPHAAHDIKVGNEATVVASEHRKAAKVIQVHHKLDEKTRTIAVRLEVENHDDELHPGLFVQTQIQTSEKSKALTLPTEAVLRSPDGDWAVFVEEAPGKFKSQEINVIAQLGDLIKIEGIDVGTRVVTKGAFFVQSEIAKSGFEVHNH